jgi:hypothetical protein
MHSFHWASFLAQFIRFVFRSVVHVAVILFEHILDVMALIVYFLDKSFHHGFGEFLLMSFRQWFKLIRQEGLGDGGTNCEEHLVLLGVGVVFLEHHLEEVLVGLFLFGLLVL